MILWLHSRRAEHDAGWVRKRPEVTLSRSTATKGNLERTHSASIGIEGYPIVLQWLTPFAKSKAPGARSPHHGTGRVRWLGESEQVG